MLKIIIFSIFETLILTSFSYLFALDTKHTIREMKSKLERINRILKDTEQWISGLEDKSRGNY